MTETPEKPKLFLERRRYRMQRMRDAAKLLPVLGIVLLFIPLLWRGEAAISNAVAVQYMFGAWGLLIVVTAIIARRIAASEADDQN